ncbi:MAG: DUF1847 domain-containing protein [Planctomycetes bacterium]|nr:DUF1847 domain-containing protein [Planctomycetota bacterium]
MTTARCASCETWQCREGKDCFGVSEGHRLLYDDGQTARLHRGASAIVARHYCKETRLAEVILLAEGLGFRKVGLAFCIGLAREAGVIAEILSRHFEVVSVCCKVGGIAKRTLGLEQVDSHNEKEAMCNPAGQAQLLNDLGTELNILCGLCVGHDAVFSMASEAPVTTLIVKDRVLAHNPIGAVYCQYVRRRLDGGGEGKGGVATKGGYFSKKGEP